MIGIIKECKISNFLHNQTNSRINQTKVEIMSKLNPCLANLSKGHVKIKSLNERIKLFGDKSNSIKISK